MFERLEQDRIDTDDASIFLRRGGSGPPLVLLHGYPETGAMWDAVTSRLVDRFTVVVPDFRGYG